MTKFKLAILKISHSIIRNKQNLFIIGKKYEASFHKIILRNMQSRTDLEPTLNNHQVVGEPKVNNTDLSVIIAHKIYPDGRMKSTKFEADNNTRNVLTKVVYQSEAKDKLLNYHVINYKSITFRIPSYLIEYVDKGVKTRKFLQTNEESSSNSKGALYGLTLFLNKKHKISSAPTMIVCQNCDMNFPTKYQYQRHQCEFNAAKVVLKANADIKDVDKGMRMKFDCPTCGKQFVSKNNLERHQTSHDETNVNICEHCQKHFVSENRLRIHKENHCKKAGDISKFYRSDVAVWKCLKCNRVFATVSSANKHAENCSDVMRTLEPQYKNSLQSEELNLLNEELKSLSTIAPEIANEIGFADFVNKYVEKVLTELLLQCEFCNRTYAEKSWLLVHQKTHTTAINYQCVKCDEPFDSYVVAAKHWLTKCSDEANLFYLPKLTFCEYCDRTFKSHDILYTHKIKKKHYMPKIHKELEVVKGNKQEFIVDNKNTIVKLIEDALMAIKVPQRAQNLKEIAVIENKINNIKSEIDVVPIATVKNEGVEQHDENGPIEKKRRGRKRKQPKQLNKNKKISVTAEPGYKYQCEKCIEIFDSISDLETHRETEHPTNFKCEECSQVVHSAKALLIHSRAHQSLKPYVCEICKRCYSQTSHLWQHMRFHQGIKPFACPHEGCEARYTIRPDLKDHIRKVHTRERPFKCAVCNKCFLTGSVYYQHRLIHTNDRRYGCDICQKRFFRADALNNHRRIHTDERPYPCEICGRQFRQKGDRNKHVRTQHPL